MQNNIKILAKTINAKLLIDENHLDWDYVCNNNNCSPVRYTRQWIYDFIEYKKSHGIELINISLVIYSDINPCGIWPIAYLPGSKNPLIVYKNGILPPLFLNTLSNKVIKKKVKECLDFLDKLVSTINGKAWNSIEGFSCCIGISEWQHQAMLRGASLETSHDLYVDLSLSMTEIKKRFRKSFKPLIGVGYKEWDVSIMQSNDVLLWNEFVDLHAKVSGRVTRSERTWSLQLECIRNNNAFLICLHDKNKKLIGGGLFYITKSFGAYMCGVYERSLFDKPLGHVVQLQAMIEMKSRGVLWYDIGERPYIADSNSSTDKEKSIAHFKQGFTTHIFPKMNLTYEY